MLYNDITPGKVYKNQQIFNYPTGVKKGVGELAIICAPTWKASLDFIANDVNRWYMNGYKRYYTPTKYATRIGNKTIKELRLQTIKTEFNDHPISKELALISNQTQLTSNTNKKYSIIYDIS